MNKRIITLVVLACLSLHVNADEIQLQKNHPERHVVVKGDTLWGISGRFLKDPWQWPKVWRMNREQIKNPHLIYPGDVVVLDTSSGTPQFKLLRETVTLKPGVRVEPLEKEAIFSIAPNVIGPFLSQPLLIENGKLDAAPRIISGQDNRVVLSPGTRVYINEINEGEGTHWNIYRPGELLRDPDTQEVLGTEAIYLEMQILHVLARQQQAILCVLKKRFSLKTGWWFRQTNLKVVLCHTRQIHKLQAVLSAFMVVLQKVAQTQLCRLIVVKMMA